jgi:hypothetical protein
MHVYFEFQRWVALYSRNVQRFGVFTTNGLERQHEALKHGYLAQRNGGSMTDLLTVLVTQFIPACRSRLVLINEFSDLFHIFNYDL